MVTTHYPKQHCLYCNVAFDAASEVWEEGKRPKPDDATICIACGGLMIFTEGLGVRKPTEEERKQLERDVKVQHAQMALAHTKGWKRQ